MWVFSYVDVLMAIYVIVFDVFLCLLYSVQNLIWVILNILTNLILNLISLLAWCTFFFHSFMMILMVIIMSWYGASYYLDYFAYLALRKAIQNNEIPTQKNGGDAENPTDLENEKDEDTEVAESLRHNLEIALEEGSESDSDMVWALLNPHLSPSPVSILPLLPNFPNNLFPCLSFKTIKQIIIYHVNHCLLLFIHFLRFLRQYSIIFHK